MKQIKKVVRIKKEEVKDIINQIPFSAFFGVEFVKADSSIRNINCNRMISKRLKHQRENFKVFHDMLNVYDVNAPNNKNPEVKGGYRKVNLDTVLQINTNHTSYVVVS